MPLDLRHQVNYDHPDAFDTELLMNHPGSIARGEGSSSRSTITPLTLEKRRQFTSSRGQS